VIADAISIKSPGLLTLAADAGCSNLSPIYPVNCVTYLPGPYNPPLPSPASGEGQGGARQSRNSGTIQNGFCPRATRSKLSKALRQRFQ